MDAITPLFYRRLHFFARRRWFFHNDDLSNNSMSALFAATAEATQEAIYNSLFKAQTVTSNGSTVEALPLDRTLEILRRYGAIR